MSHTDQCISLVIDQESALLTAGVRTDSAQLVRLLHPNFVEIGCSGAVYHFADVIVRLPQSTSRMMELSDPQVVFATDGAVAIVYTLLVDAQPHSVRFSLWVKRVNGWQLKYHDGQIMKPN